MFYSFHTMSFISMTCLRSPLLQLLPKGCSACCCALLNSFYHPVPGAKLLPLLSHLWPHRSHLLLFNTKVFSVPHLPFLQSMELTAIILAHGPTAPSIWDFLRSVPPNILNSCSGAALWNSSHRKGPCCAGCCTYKSVGRGKQVYYSILLLDHFRKGRLQQFSSKALVCLNPVTVPGTAGKFT